MGDAFISILKAAHEGALGDNNLPAPTQKQLKNSEYIVGETSFHGLQIAIENPQGTHRSGTDKHGNAWSTRMQSHYGYIQNTLGADGDEVDCFIGAYPESDQVFVINQIDPVTKRFDEHKVMLGMLSEADAINNYQFSYDKDWQGMGVVVPLSVSQLKWWLLHGDTTAALTRLALPLKGFETMDKVTWSGDTPEDVSMDALMYNLRRHDDDGLLLDAVSAADIEEDADEVDDVLLDGLVVPFNKLDRKMTIMQKIMGRVSDTVNPIGFQITKPFKQRGVAQVAVIFELSDGQTISAYFHNPDADPKRILPTDDLVSWKWMLNKKDITIIAAPERGKELLVNEVARRMMKLAAKNSSAFQRANAKRADRMGNIAALKNAVSSKQKELQSLNFEIERLQVEAETKVMITAHVDQIPAVPVVMDADNKNVIGQVMGAKNYGEDVVSVYVTKTGVEAMVIRQLVDVDGYVTYSFIGKYGAASGSSYDDMQKEVQSQQASRRGMVLLYGREFSEIKDGTSNQVIANTAVEEIPSLPIADEAGEAQEQLAIDAHVRAWSIEAEKINNVVAAINWEAIIDYSSAIQEEKKLRDAIYDIGEIQAAKTVLKCISFDMI